MIIICPRFVHTWNNHILMNDNYLKSNWYWVIFSTNPATQRGYYEGFCPLSS